MSMKSSWTDMTFITPGIARSSELTTSFIPGLREIIRSGRSARKVRSVLSAAKAGLESWSEAPVSKETHEMITMTASS